MKIKHLFTICISISSLFFSGVLLNQSPLKAEENSKDTIFSEEALSKLEAGFTDEDDLDKFGGLEFNFKKSKHLKTFRGFDFNKKALKTVKSNRDAITAGKGIWVNIWNYPKNVDAFIDRLEDYHIDTVYLQVNRSTTEVFRHQVQIDEILKACKKADIKIIGWSYAYLHDVKADADKFIKPALYVSPEGYSFDAMAADIEENYKVESVKKYTELIKAALPEDYPLVAIVFSPQIKPVYPWEYIAENWDILMPMVYWHGIKQRDLEGCKFRCR